MRVLDILNLKPRKLNHHEEVCTSVKLQIANKHWTALGSQPLLQANPAAALPLLSMIGQA